MTKHLILECLKFIKQESYYMNRKYLFCIVWSLQLFVINSSIADHEWTYEWQTVVVFLASISYIIIKMSYVYLFIMTFNVSSIDFGKIASFMEFVWIWSFFSQSLSYSNAKNQSNVTINLGNNELQSIWNVLYDKILKKKNKRNKKK